ncbi:MAG: ABC-F family ATP-binding cassette domain-containing protein [Suipraeoptans sp.]
MLLSCNKITKSFATDQIIKDASFFINDYEKVAIDGPNGTGKTTLLKIITGNLEPDSGTVTIAKGKTFGYLAQKQNIESHNTIYEEVKKAKAYIIELENKIRNAEIELSTTNSSEQEFKLNTYNNLMAQFELENGYALESEITGVLKGLGFDESEFSKKVDTLSGGQKTRIALGKLLLSKPELLILDEPTNHLDLKSIGWLETFLLNYKGAVLIVSHDRYFLNKVVTKVCELDAGILHVYSGNYEEYATKRSDKRRAALKEYLKQQSEIKHQEAVIEKLRSFNREKSIKRAESRVKQLDKVERIEKPMEVNTKMNLSLTPEITSGNDVLSVDSLRKSYSSNLLFSNIDFDIRRKEHVALIGDNGTGKTTILKILNGIVTPDGGGFTLGTNVNIGYYDQEYHVLNESNTIMEEISDTYPSLTNTRIRNILAAFLFTGDDVYKLISNLSGGEKGRVALAKLMLSKSNFLILDEPTNHLDMDSKEILEEALNNYEGTILYVSHDRYFINKTATRILELSEKQITNYVGNYDYYIEKRDILSPTAQQDNDNSNDETLAKLSWQEQKEEKAREQKRKSDLTKCESEISNAESRISYLDEQMTLEEVYTNSVELQKIANEKSELTKELDELYNQWETLETND